MYQAIYRPMSWSRYRPLSRPIYGLMSGRICRPMYRPKLDTIDRYIDRYYRPIYRLILDTISTDISTNILSTGISTNTRYYLSIYWPILDTNDRCIDQSIGRYIDQYQSIYWQVECPSSVDQCFNQYIDRWISTNMLGEGTVSVKYRWITKNIDR